MTAKDGVARRSHLVVGLDDSEQSVTALRWAAGYAALTQSELELVHAWAIEPSEMYGVTVGLREGAAAEARETMTDLVTRTIGASGDSCRWRMNIVEGKPGPVLVQRSAGADLLVLGTGEHTGVGRLVSGSVSHYCLSHAQLPVVAVPTNAKASRAGKSSADSRSAPERLVGP